MTENSSPVHPELTAQIRALERDLEMTDSDRVTATARRMTRLQD